VKEQLRRVPNRGWLRRSAVSHRKPTITATPVTQPQVFNYLGQVDSVVADSNLFAFAHESAGRVHSPAVNRRHLIEIIGQVLDGCLRITWLYSENIHRAETIERLGKNFMNALGVLLPTASPSLPAIPSDFPTG